MPNQTTRTPERDAKFLEALAAGASIHAAASAAGYARASLYRWRTADAEFAAAWSDAVEAGTDALEDEVLRRAKDGVEEPRFYEGQICGHVRKYSDILLMFLLKARRPEKYSERVTNTHQGADGGPMITEIRRIIVKPGDRLPGGGIVDSIEVERLDTPLPDSPPSQMTARSPRSGASSSDPAWSAWPPAPRGGPTSVDHE